MEAVWIVAHLPMGLMYVEDVEDGVARQVGMMPALKPSLTERTLARREKEARSERRLGRGKPGGHYFTCRLLSLVAPVKTSG